MKSNGTKSLTRLIALSEGVLSSAGQDAFHALSVLPPKPATFSLEMALALVDEPSADGPRPVYELIDHGLIEPVGGGRFTIHQSIAQ